LLVGPVQGTDTYLGPIGRPAPGPPLAGHGQAGAGPDTPDRRRPQGAAGALDA